ncbi:hypothetical protein Y032_0157g3223 [Ancylostoma ceylanicum]|uniref:Uncharacterized protein n=1 Tax=Ancylostoma ceylanicum TaxID=53326 RepID=A0A016SZ78_9BILA|nr:hypothetical protein Y032_0157g3223 [Ancylostoma ceylanicum]
MQIAPIKGGRKHSHNIYNNVLSWFVLCGEGFLTLRGLVVRIMNNFSRNTSLEEAGFLQFVISTIAASNTPDCRRRMEMLPYACKESVKNLVVKEISATKEGKSMDYDCIFEYGALVKLEGGDARLRKVFPGLRYKAWRSFSK